MTPTRLRRDDRLAKAVIHVIDQEPRPAIGHAERNTGFCDRPSVADCLQVFAAHDAALTDERYNLLNAWLATIPGNSARNLRGMYVLNTNYADLSFLFTLARGKPRNDATLEMATRCPRRRWSIPGNTAAMMLAKPIRLTPLTLVR